MQKRNNSTTYVGTTEAIDFLIERHPGFFPPDSDELFAFARHHGTDRVVYAIVSEPEPDLEAVSCRWSGLTMKEAEFQRLQRLIADEARECQIEAPYSVTIVNKYGALSFPVRRRKRRTRRAS